jgi:hypothetical protein
MFGAHHTATTRTMSANRAALGRVNANPNAHATAIGRRRDGAAGDVSAYKVAERNRLARP